MQLIVKDGKVFDEDSQTFPPTTWEWKDHKDHEIVDYMVPMRSLVYEASLCSCGTLLLDSSQ